MHSAGNGVSVESLDGSAAIATAESRQKDPDFAVLVRCLSGHRKGVHVISAQRGAHGSGLLRGVQG